MHDRRRLLQAILLVALLATAIAASAIPARSTYGAQVSVDEPQYLMTALSLGNDLNLDIDDEIAGGEYLDFHEVPLNTQTINLRPDGQRISPHDPLLPAILALPMRLGGWQAARATLSVLAGLLAGATLWLAVVRLGVAAWTATWVVGALSAAPPLVSYGSQVYPEVPAALAMVLAVGAVLGSPSRRSLLLFTLATTALCWLSVKYVPTTLVLVLLGLRRLVRTNHRAAALGVATALTALGIVYLTVHQRVYGGWTVYAAGDHFVASEFQVIGTNPDLWGRSRRLLGLLVDRSFGLAPWTPAWLTLSGFLAAFVRRRPDGWDLLALPFAAGWATATWVALTMHGWWWPGRQLVVVLPLAIVLIAHGVDRARATLAPVVAGSLVGTGAWLWLAVEASTRRRTIVVDFEETAWPIYRLLRHTFPDVRGSTGAMLWAGAWGVLVVALAVWGWRSVGRDQDARGSEGADADVPPLDLNSGGAIR